MIFCKTLKRLKNFVHDGIQKKTRSGLIVAAAWYYRWWAAFWHLSHEKVAELAKGGVKLRPLAKLVLPVDKNHMVRREATR